MGQINELTLLLLNSAGVLATWCYGDDSFKAWRLMGDLSTVVLALGFHRGSHDDPTVPAYLIELRNRAVAVAYELDKSLATFVGRPPRLQRRYCTLEMPLDLDDAVITGSSEAFEAAKARLDSSGWSWEGVMHPISRIRASFMLNLIREEILEMSLGLPSANLGHEARYVTSY